MSRLAQEFPWLVAVATTLLVGVGCTSSGDANPFDPHEACHEETAAVRAEKDDQIATLRRELNVAQDDLEALRRHAERQEREVAGLREANQQLQQSLDAAIALVHARDQELAELRDSARPAAEGELPGAMELLRQKDQQIKRLQDALVSREGGAPRELPESVEKGVRLASVDLDLPIARLDNQTFTRRDLAEYLYADLANRSLLDLFLNRHLVLRAARRSGVEVSDVDAEAWVANQILAQVQEAGGEAQWEARLQELGWGRRAWEARLRYQARPMLALERLIDRERGAGAVGAIFEARVKAAYEEAYSTRVSGRHILFATPRNPTDAQLAQALRAAEQTWQQLQKGASFTDLAAKLSQDPETRRLGGYLGEFGREKFANLPELNTALFSLEVGRASRPIRTQLGYHLVLVDERREPSRPFDEATRRELAARLRGQPASPEEQAAMVADLRRAARIEALPGF